jgi:putative transposase
MPWMKTTPSEERQRFVHDYESGQWSMSELCERYRVSRPTGYAWLRRAASGDEDWFEERSHAVRSCPHRTPVEVERLLVSARKKYGWGAAKLRTVLVRWHPALAWPALSTLNAILDRNGLVHRRRKRRRWPHPGAAPLVTERPNQVWPIDFKGQFRMRDAQYCYPLTVTDHFSRRLLLCKGLLSVKAEGVQPALRKLFREVGMPEAIRSDNGVPFASLGLHGLCSLNVWWMQLGIVHQRIRPSSPQENGTHERMHKELKREATHPAADHLRAQQRKFDRFQARYNDERPHDALGGDTPSQRWTPSPRRYPERLPKPHYDSHLEVRRVSDNGTIRLHAEQIFLSRALKHQDVALEAIGDGLWNLVYYQTLLARVDERSLTVTGAGNQPQ